MSIQMTTDTHPMTRTGLGFRTEGLGLELRHKQEPAKDPPYHETQAQEHTIGHDLWKARHTRSRISIARGQGSGVKKGSGFRCCVSF